jgi:hypothetical protein
MLHARILASRCADDAYRSAAGSSADEGDAVP